MSEITEDCWARVRLLSNCPGDGRKPHHRTEEGSRVQVSTTRNQGDHSVYARYSGAVVSPPLLKIAALARSDSPLHARDGRTADVFSRSP